MMEDREMNKGRLTQRLLGLILIVLGLIIPFLDYGDITVPMVFLPVGIYTIVTKNNVLNREKLSNKPDKAVHRGDH